MVGLPWQMLCSRKLYSFDKNKNAIKLCPFSLNYAQFNNSFLNFLWFSTALRSLDKAFHNNGATTENALLLVLWSLVRLLVSTLQSVVDLKVLRYNLKFSFFSRYRGRFLWSTLWIIERIRYLDRSWISNMPTSCILFVTLLWSVFRCRNINLTLLRMILCIFRVALCVRPWYIEEQ